MCPMLEHLIFFEYAQRRNHLDETLSLKTLKKTLYFIEISGSSSSFSFIQNFFCFEKSHSDLSNKTLASR